MPFRDQLGEDGEVNADPEYLQHAADVLAVHVDLFSQHYINTYGSLHAIEERAVERSSKVYQAMDESNGFYTNIVDPTFRSRMNCVFRIGDGNIKLEKLFTKQAEERGIFQLFGHPLMGGLRITLYNGIPDDAVDAVLDFMKEFQKNNQHLLH